MNRTEYERYYSIGEAAAAVHTTTETLRHYDRIGLVRPGRKDEWTNYRYYTEQDIVRLNTVRALQLMDLPLKEIKKVLEYDSLEEIIDFLDHAEMKAAEKIAALQRSRKKIKAARADYERKLQWREDESGIFIRDLPERAILLSDTLEEPSLDNLWNYLSHFYKQLPPEAEGRFCFDDQAGIYTDDKMTRLFAVCTQWDKGVEGLRILPAGKYLCMNCNEADRKSALQRLECIAGKDHGAAPAFSIQMIIVSGILQWNYQIQVLIADP